MNPSNIGEYYDYAFKLLEYGKNMESIGREDEAVTAGYRPACMQLRLLFQAEPDQTKRDLLGQQIAFFENKLQLYHQKQSMPPQQPTQPPQQHMQPQQPPPPVSQLTDLCNRADRAYKDAIRLDTDPTTTTRPSSTGGSARRNEAAEARYMEAAELFMQASKLCASSTRNKQQSQQQQTLTATVSSILDRVGQLRGHTGTKASPQTGSSKSSSSDDDTFLAEFDNLLPSINPTRPLVDGRKGGTLSTPPSARPSSAPRAAITSHSSGRPVSGGKSGDLSANEIAILRRSSFINGRCFLPWMDDERTENFNGPPGKRFTDPDGLLPLSTSQISKQAKYKRIHEIVAASSPSGGAPPQPVLIKAVSPLAITQDLVADCSFVCSLCIAAAFEARFQKKLITSIIFPQNERGVPVYNPSGKYLVKLFMNGIMRKVVVDDYLPVSTHLNSQGQEVYRPLCSCSSDPTEYWISLVEKAYMKLNGGYDFPGSNSGIDLHALTGWLPEHVFFAEDRDSTSSSGSGGSSGNKTLDCRQREDDVWERISSAHKFGDCLITISTSSKLSEETQEASGLVPGHAYAVLNVCQAGTLRMLQVKNPWARRSWKGRFSSRDRGRWTPGLQKALGVADSDFDKMDKQGIFWIDYSDCREYFRSFFLNWNAALFVFRTTVHGVWPVSLGPKIDTYYIGASPQYSLKVQGSTTSGSNAGNASAPGVGTSIWILLSRHVVTKDVDPDTLSAAAAAALRDDETYLTMHIYRDGQRLFAPSKPMLRGIYSSDPHVLSRIDISESESKTAQDDVSLEYPHGKPIEYTLVLSQAEKRRDVYYTLSVYSTTLPFELKACPPLPSNQLTVTGGWKSGVNAGGNVNSRTFHLNPQYKLHIPPVVRGGIDMHIHAMCGKDISASISVVDVSKNNNNKNHHKKSDDEDGERTAYARIDCIASDEAEVLTSGSYRSGFCVCSTSLKSKAEAEAAAARDGKQQRHSKGKGKTPSTFHLQAGDYTVVLSAYTPQSVGNFALTFATTAGSVDDSSAGGMTKPKHVRKYFTVKEIPPEGWGLQHFGRSGEWCEADQTAGGCVNSGAFHTNPIYFVHLPDDATISARLNVATNSGKSGVGLNVSIFPLPPADTSTESPNSLPLPDEDGKTQPTPPPSSAPPTVESHAEYSTRLQSSGASPRTAALTSNDGVYVVRPTGAFIPPSVLRAGSYLIVPSTFKQITCKFTLDMYLTPSIVHAKAFTFVKPA